MQKQEMEYYFNVLALPATASLDEVIQARKHFAQVLHPDKVAARPELKEWSSERMKQINVACDKLKAWFDAGCPRSTNTSTAAGPYSSSASNNAAASNSNSASNNAADWSIWEESPQAAGAIDNGVTLQIPAGAKHQAQPESDLWQAIDTRQKIANTLKTGLIAFFAVAWLAQIGLLLNPANPALSHLQNSQSTPSDLIGTIILILLSVSVDKMLRSSWLKQLEFQWIHFGTFQFTKPDLNPNPKPSPQTSGTTLNTNPGALQARPAPAPTPAYAPASGSTETPKITASENRSSNAKEAPRPKSKTMAEVYRDISQREAAQRNNRRSA